MATDYVTSPTTRDGQIVFGLIIGALTGVIRLYGGYPEGICYAILLANTLVPALTSGSARSGPSSRGPRRERRAEGRAGRAARPRWAGPRCCASPSR